jgi:hypothetical protein
MDQDKLSARLEQMFDNALVYHGYTNYMRDYELIVYQSADPRSRIQPRYLRFLFIACPEASIRSAIRPEIWSRSMDPRLLAEHSATEESPGYVWGVQTQELYPGPKVIENSVRARKWTNGVGIPFHEVDIEANAHRINLIFAYLSVEEVKVGYSPFEVGRTMVAEAHETGSKIPLDLWDGLPTAGQNHDPDA